MMVFLPLNFAELCERSDCDTEELYRVLSALPPISTNGPWLAGGALRRVLLKQPLDSDFDFFFRDETQLSEWRSALPPHLSLIRETAHHIHYRGTLNDSAIPVNVQAIKFAFYGSADAVIDSFDYSITQFAFDGERLTTTPYALWDTGRRKLALHKITYPVSTMRRMLKYTRQGFTACSGCMATLLRETANSPEAMSQLGVEYVD